MKERPLMMSGPMARAVREGSKTQTRRVIKPQPPAGFGCIGTGYVGDPTGKFWGLWIDESHPDPVAASGAVLHCPYGKPGDRLWVREGFFFNGPGRPTGEAQDRQHVVYRADGGWTDYVSWQPSIHMPRWASRLTLEITDIRVEQVQDISVDDALAEGVDMNGGKDCPAYCFAQLWDSINGKRGFGWETNPWVFVLTFRKAEQEKGGNRPTQHPQETIHAHVS